MDARQPRHILSRQVFTCLMVISVGCLFLPRSLTDKLDYVLGWLVSPFSKGGRYVSLAVTDKLAQSPQSEVSLQQYQHVVDLLRRSEAERINCRGENRYLREITAQLSALRSGQLLGMDRVALIEAEVIGNDASNQRQVLRLDQGALQQVRAGQMVLCPVISVDGADKDKYDYQMCVVGRISKAGVGSSFLQLINDSAFSMAAVIEPRWRSKDKAGWRVQGMLSAGAGQSITIKLVSCEYSVQAGDVVLAPADQTNLPVDILLGYVQNCRRDDQNPVMLQIVVSPAADLEKIRRVWVVSTDKKQE